MEKSGIFSNGVVEGLRREILSADLANDAAGASHVVSELEGISTQTLDVWFTELRSPDFVPMNVDVPEGVTEWSFRVHKKVGLGRFISATGGDMPYANVSERKITYDLELAGLGYKVTREEIRNAAYYRRSIDSSKANSAIFGSAKHSDTVAFVGDDTQGFRGLTNQESNNVLANYSPPTGNWATATEDEIRADFTGSIRSMISSTNEIHGTSRNRQLQFALPSDRFDLLASMPTGDNKDKMLLETLKWQNPYTSRTGIPLMILPLIELETAGNTGTNHRGVLYEKHLDVLEMSVPIPFRFLAPQFVALEIRVPGEYKVSGVNIKRPGGVLYVENL